VAVFSVSKPAERCIDLYQHQIGNFYFFPGFVETVQAICISIPGLNILGHVFRYLAIKRVRGHSYHPSVTLGLLGTVIYGFVEFQPVPI